MKIRLVFEYDASDSKPMTKFVRFKNNTESVLRYTLSKCAKPSVFRDIVPETDPELVFFYTKRQRVVVPGEDAPVAFSFQTNRRGRYAERVRIVLKPNAFEAAMTVEFDATATFVGAEARCDEIGTELTRRCATAAARDALDAALGTVPPPTAAHPEAYGYDKAATFEAVNREFDPVAGSPKYLYDKDVVRELEDFYGRVRGRNRPRNWDCNLRRLRLIVCSRWRRRAGDANTCGCGRENDGGKRKEDRNGEIADWVRKCGCAGRLADDIARRKEGVTENDDDENVDERGLEDELEELEELTYRLERPCVRTNRDRTKYVKTYATLCAQFDKICEEIEGMDERWGITRACTYPRLTEPDGADRRRVEVFEDVVLRRSVKVSEAFGEDDKPASYILKNVPMDDCAARYNAYYGIDKLTSKEKAEKTKGGKGKTGKEESKTGKSKDGAKKPKRNKQLEIKRNDAGDKIDDVGIALKTRDLFDPASMSHSSSVEYHDGGKIEVRDVQCPPEISGQYEQNMYAIFYLNLEKAVDKIAIALEEENRETLRPDVLKRALETNPHVFTSEAGGVPNSRRPSVTYSESALKFEDELEKWRCEPLLEKKSGSLWSILRKVKDGVDSGRPVSYPKRYYRSKCRDRGAVVDVYTATSGAEVDPNWQNFRDVAVQGEIEGGDVTVCVHVADILEDVCNDVERNTSE